MKSFFFLSSLAFAAVAPAAFDFEQSFRHNPSVPLPGEFMHVTPDGSNGYYAVARIAGGTGIARFNGANQLIAYRFWQGESVNSLRRDSAGRIHLVFDEEGIAVFSAGLEPLWEYAGGFSVQTRTAMLESGETLVANAQQSGTHLRVIRPDGTLLTDRMLPDRSARAVCAVNAAGGGRGFALASSSNDRGRVIRIDLLGNMLFDRIDSAPVGPFAGIEKMVADANGVISGVGRAGPDSHLSYYKVSPTGTITHAFDPVLKFREIVGIEMLDAATARCGAWDPTGSDIVDFGRNGLNVLRRHTLSVTGFTYSATWALDSDGTLLASLNSVSSAPSHAFESWSAPGIGNPIGSGMFARAATRLSGGAAKFVGRNSVTGRAAVSTTRTGTTLQHEEYSLIGYPKRQILDEVRAPNGDFAFLTDIPTAYSDHGPATLASYSAMGAVNFSREIPGVNPGNVGGSLLQLDDGSFVVLGTSTVHNFHTAIARVSPNGTLLGARHYKFGDTIAGEKIARIPGTSDILVLAPGGSDPMGLLRLRPDGSVVYRVNYAASFAESELMTLDTGRILMRQRFQNGTLLRTLDPATGTTVQYKSFPYEPVHAILDLPGSALAFLTSVSQKIRVRRFEESTLAVTHWTDLSIGRNFRKASAGPDGRMAISYKEGDEFGMRVMNGANLTLATPEFTLPSSVTNIVDVEMAAGNELYVLGQAGDPSWMAKYSPVGALVKVQSPAGTPRRLYSTSSNVWTTTATGVRHRGVGPAVYRYTR